MPGGGYLLETLKSSLLFNFRTGNVIIDTLVTGIIICLTTYMMNLASNLQNLDIRGWLSFYFFGPSTTSNEIIISGKKFEGSQMSNYNYSTTFQALLYQIKKLDCASSNISKLSEIQLRGIPQLYRVVIDRYGRPIRDDQSNHKEPNLIVSQKIPFKIAKDVEARVRITEMAKSSQNGDGRGDQGNVKIEEFEITISSTVLSMNQLRSLINDWLNEYQEFLAPDKYLRFFLYSPPNQSPKTERDIMGYDSRGMPVGIDHYTEFQFESGKSFKNVFFPQKDTLIKRLDFFRDNKSWYKSRGIPYTLGLLLHGIPGCGKTSTIKAIANHTQRHIVSVPLNRIKTSKQLLEIFYQEDLNHMKVPLSKRLYVIEDIDCSELKDIVGDRSSSAHSSNEDQDSGNGSSRSRSISDDDAQNFLNLIRASSHKAMDNLDKDKKELTLAGLLEVLDGVMEMDGRMMVITTNYPDRLDSALTRPGRIDMKLKFERCTNESLIEMYKHFFNDRDIEVLWPENFDKSHVPNDRWTPAEASQIFLNNIQDPQKGLLQLINDFPQAKDNVDMISTKNPEEEPSSST